MLKPVLPQRRLLTQFPSPLGTQRDAIGRVPQTEDAPIALPLQIKRVLDTTRQQSNPFVE